MTVSGIPQPGSRHAHRSIAYTASSEPGLHVLGFRFLLAMQTAASADTFEVFPRYGESGRAVSVPATAKMSVSALVQLGIGRLAALPLGTPPDTVDAFTAEGVVGTRLVTRSLPALDNSTTLNEAGIAHRSHVVLLKTTGERHARGRHAVQCHQLDRCHCLSRHVSCSRTQHCRCDRWSRERLLST